MRAILFALLMLGLGIPAAWAQTSDPYVVAACGTVPAGVWNPGGQAKTTVDVTGKLCAATSAGGGGGTPLSPFSEIVPANVTSVAIKAGAGTLYGIDGFSIAATQPVWIKLYDALQGSVTCGAGTPKLRYMIPGQGAGGSGAIMHDANGVTFATGITACVTTGIADADTGVPAAATYTFNAVYK